MSTYVQSRGVEVMNFLHSRLTFMRTRGLLLYFLGMISVPPALLSAMSHRLTTYKRTSHITSSPNLNSGSSGRSCLRRRSHIVSMRLLRAGGSPNVSDGG